jgi:hypothetical protein
MTAAYAAFSASFRKRQAAISGAYKVTVSFNLLRYVK